MVISFETSTFETEADGLEEPPPPPPPPPEPEFEAYCFFAREIPSSIIPDISEGTSILSRLSAMYPFTYDLYFLYSALLTSIWNISVYFSRIPVI